MNQYNAIGRLGGDPEIRSTPQGNYIMSFRVAVRVGFGKNESTLWVQCNKWGAKDKSGSDLQGLSQYLHKGDQVGFTGELSLDEWTDRSGATRTSLICTVRDVTLLGGSMGEKQETPPAASQEPQGGGSFVDDDIPFAQFDRGMYG